MRMCSTIKGLFYTLLLLATACAQPKTVNAPVPVAAAPTQNYKIQNLTGESFGYRAALPSPPTPVVQVASGNDDENDYLAWLDHLKMNSWNLYGSSLAGDTGANGNPISVLNPPVVK